MMRSPLLFGMAFGLSVLGAGCSSLSDPVSELRYGDRTNPGVCPNTFVLADAARQIVFDGAERAEDVAWSVEITDISSACRYVADEPIRAEVAMTIEVGRGPAASSQDHEIAYFVGVTRRNADVIAKETFTVPVRIRQAYGTTTLTQTIGGIEIPRAGAGVSGDNFEIAVGLGLTQEQVVFNRSGRSLKFPEIQ